MNCRYCGTELPPGAMFCGECGRAVVAEAASTTAVIPPAPAATAPAPNPTAAAGPAPVASAAPVPAMIPAMPLAFSSAEAASDDPVDHVPAVAPAAVCPQCGALVESDEVFCGECGFVLRGVPAVPPPPGPPPIDDVPIDPVPGEQEPMADPEPRRAPDLGETDIVPALEPDLASSVETPPQPVPGPAGPQGVEVEDIEATRLSVDPLAGQRFVLQFSTGENVTIAGAGLVGRNPIAQPGEYVDQLVAVFDPSKSVSKTHLEFGQERGRFWVSDRFSTNGSVVRQPDAEPKRCEPGKRYFVARGTRIDIGEQFFVVS